MLAFDPLTPFLSLTMLTCRFRWQKGSWCWHLTRLRKASVGCTGTVRLCTCSHCLHAGACVAYEARWHCTCRRVVIQARLNSYEYQYEHINVTIIQAQATLPFELVTHPSKSGTCSIDGGCTRQSAVGGCVFDLKTGLLVPGVSVGSVLSNDI